MVSPAKFVAGEMCIVIHGIRISLQIYIHGVFALCRCNLRESPGSPRRPDNEGALSGCQDPRRSESRFLLDVFLIRAGPQLRITRANENNAIESRSYRECRRT